MLTTQRDREDEAAGTFEKPESPYFSIPNSLHPVELYAKADKGRRADILFHSWNVIGFLCIHEGIISKAFLAI